MAGFHSKTFYDKIASLDCRPSQSIFCCLVSLNPSPRWKYPCMVCSKPVKINQKGICCDSCDDWFHTKCLNMDDRTYISNCSCSWFCEQCGLPNSSTSFINSISYFGSSNSFSSLSGSSAQLKAISRSIWSPSPQENVSKSQRAAFATKKITSTNNNLPSPTSLKIVIVNCNRTAGRKSNPEFQSFINQHSPDIMLGCESKLDGEPTYSVFPSNYTVYRKDRNSAGEGDFNAIRDTLVSCPLNDLDPNCEIVWATLQLNGCKKLIMASYYCPPKSSIDEAEQFCTSVNQVFASHSPNYPQVLIGGDFNLPGINWGRVSATSQTDVSISLTLLDCLHLNNLTQLLEKPTRGKNILDLLLTSNPNIAANEFHVKITASH